MKYGKVLVSLPKNYFFCKIKRFIPFYTKAKKEFRLSRAAAGVRRNLRHAYSLPLKARELKLLMEL
jgi:hypothetical protein